MHRPIIATEILDLEEEKSDTPDNRYNLILKDKAAAGLNVFAIDLCCHCTEIKNKTEQP